MADPSHAHRPAHTMDTRHPQALFPALVAPDSRPMVGILALQGDAYEHSSALEAAGARPVVVRRATDLGEAPGHRLNGLVIPGGESATMSMLLTAFEILAPLHEFIGTGLSAHGFCAGMITLVDHVKRIQEGQASLGGIDMTVRRNAFGRQVNSYEEDLIAPELGAGPDRPLCAVFIRAPWVEEMGPGVEILTTTRVGRVAEAGGADGGRAVVIRQESPFAMSFHPEVGGDHRVRDVFVPMVTRRA